MSQTAASYGSAMFATIQTSQVKNNLEKSYLKPLKMNKRLSQYNLIELFVCVNALRPSHVGTFSWIEPVLNRG